jgi:5-methylcytosine-specific restriction endonuclease McrA
MVREVRARDGDGCFRCHVSIDFTLRYPHPGSRSLDHAVPVSRRGSYTLANARLSHLNCNSKAGAKT